MKVIIDIPDHEIPEKQDIISVDIHFIDGEVCECTYGFQVLPKGYGRLIDERQITECNQVGLDIRDGTVTRWFVTDAPTIIEADKENE